MAGALRKTMVYLGLAEEDDRYYDDDVRPDETFRYDRSEPAGYAREERDAQVTPIKRTGSSVAAPTPVQHETTRPAAALHRITTIHPRSYNDAKAIGESFRHGVPVIMNLSDMDDADAKRMVDFAAGLVFGLHGAIERVTSKVFLLSPEHIEVSGDEVGQDSEHGFYNQS